MDADTLDTAHPGLATASQVRRVGEQVTGLREDFVAHVADERATLTALATTHAEGVQVARQTLSGIERLVVTSEARAAHEAERRAAEAAEAERSRQWWRAMWDAVTGSRLVQILVLVAAVLLVPELRPLISAYLGVAAPAPVVQVEATTEEVAP
jgi:hypothetical protein